MQDGESNHAKARSKENSSSPEAVSFIHSWKTGSYWYLQMGRSPICVTSVDCLKVCVDDVGGNHRADKCTLRLPTSYWLYPTLAIGCIPPVILLEPQSLVVHGVYLVHADKCVNFLLTNNVLCLVSPIPCFYFCKDDLQGGGGGGGHVGWVPGRCSNPGMGGKLSLNIDHMHAFSLMYFPLRKYFPSSPPWSQDSY